MNNNWSFIDFCWFQPEINELQNNSLKQFRVSCVVEKEDVLELIEMSLVFLLVIRGIKTIASFVSAVGIPVGFITLLITLFSTLDNGFVKLLEIIMKKKNIKNLKH